MSVLGPIFAASPSKNNLAAAVAPAVGNDSSQGYSVGSHWVDTTANKAYICVDASVGAAIWLEVGSTVHPVELGVAQEWTKQQTFDAQVLTDEANIDWNLDDEEVAQITLGDDRTMNAPTNMKDGGTYILHVKQDGTGTRLITWNAVFKWSGGVAPTLTTTLTTGHDILSFVSDGVSMFGTCVLDYQ